MLPSQVAFSVSGVRLEVVVMAVLRGRVEPLVEDSWSNEPFCSRVWWRAVGSAMFSLAVCDMRPQSNWRNDYTESH